MGNESHYEKSLSRIIKIDEGIATKEMVLIGLELDSDFPKQATKQKRGKRKGMCANISEARGTQSRLQTS